MIHFLVVYRDQIKYKIKNSNKTVMHNEHLIAISSTI